MAITPSDEKKIRSDIKKLFERTEEVDRKQEKAINGLSDRIKELERKFNNAFPPPKQVKK